jgi:ketosteroid isomerase-like protein
MTTTTTFAEVAEAVRATIAAYTHALDDGRVDDVVATYCPDGVFDLPGTGTFEGHDALRQAYDGWRPRRPQRHLVVNTHVTDWSDDEATALSDVVLILEGSSGWGVQFVSRYRDVLHRHGGRWTFHRRTVG